MERLLGAFLGFSLRRVSHSCGAETRASGTNGWPPQRPARRRSRKLLVLPQHVSLSVNPREFSHLVELPFDRFCRGSAVSCGRRDCEWLLGCVHGLVVDEGAAWLRAEGRVLCQRRVKVGPYPEGDAGQLSHGPSRVIRLTREGGSGFLIPRTGDGMRCQAGAVYRSTGGAWSLPKRPRANPQH